MSIEKFEVEAAAVEDLIDAYGEPVNDGHGTHAREALREAVTDASESDTWAYAQLEWTYAGERLDGPDTCHCGQQNLVYRFIVRNKLNDQVLAPIGSTCIHEHFDLNTDLLLAVKAGKEYLQAVRVALDGQPLDLRTSFTRRALALARERGTITLEQWSTLDAAYPDWGKGHVPPQQVVAVDDALREGFARAVGGPVLPRSGRALDALAQVEADAARREQRRRAAAEQEERRAAWLGAEREWRATPEGLAWSRRERQRGIVARRAIDRAADLRLVRLADGGFLSVEDLSAEDVARLRRRSVIRERETSFLNDMRTRRHRRSSKQLAWLGSILERVETHVRRVSVPPKSLPGYAAGCAARVRGDEDEAMRREVELGFLEGYLEGVDER